PLQVSKSGKVAVIYVVPKSSPDSKVTENLIATIRNQYVPAVTAKSHTAIYVGGLTAIFAVFQWGWGSSLINTGTGPVESFLPPIMLAILFGLSMDYQVFLVSRMHEEWVHTKDNDISVRIGQAETGRVITAAATIMILIFLSFVLEGQRVIKEFGIG